MLNVLEEDSLERDTAGEPDDRVEEEKLRGRRAESVTLEPRGSDSVLRGARSTGRRVPRKIVDVSATGANTTLDGSSYTACKDDLRDKINEHYRRHRSPFSNYASEGASKPVRAIRFESSEEKKEEPPRPAVSTLSAGV